MPKWIGFATPSQAVL